MKIRRLIRAFCHGEKGFTLIELLVVIAILGILAAIIVPNFGKFFGSGQQEACQIEERMIKSALMAYVADHLGDDPTPVCTAITTADLAEFFETPESDIQGTYSFTGTFPACHVDQTACP
jgi:prepilin-type N-terminal cleavage/methylation domain-containing protein